MAAVDQQPVAMPGADRVKVGIGSSEQSGAVEAGRAAASAAVAELAGEPASLVLVYGSVGYQLPELLRGVREVTGEAPLAGASSSGHFHDGAVILPGRGVAVLALTSGPYRFGVSSVTGLTSDGRGTGQAVARAARRAAGPDPGPYAAVLLLADGLAGNQQELVSGVYKVTGAGVPVVGGCAADDRRVRGTSVFHDGEALHDAAVAVWIGSPWPLSVSVGHGWRPLGLPLLVTEVDGTAVHAIAGRPAIEVIRESLEQAAVGQQPGFLQGRPGYYPAHAFGLIEPDGSQLIRAVYLGHDGVLRTISPLPAYAAIQIVSCRPEDLVASVAPLAGAAIAGRSPSVLLAFSCVARFEVLGEDHPAAEAVALREAAGAAATFGTYTYGEFARTTGVAGFHNASLALIAL